MKSFWVEYFPLYESKPLNYPFGYAEYYLAIGK